MGLAASQARYLALTSRKSDLEYQSQTINTRRLQLAYKTSEIARAYSEGMQNKSIQISFASDEETIWKDVTWENLLENDFLVIGTGGQSLEKNQSPYLFDSAYKVYYSQTEPTVTGYKDKETGDSKTIEEYNAMTPEQKAKYIPVEEVPAGTVTKTQEEYDKLEDKTGWVRYTTTPLSKTEFDKLTPSENHDYEINYKVNPSYEEGKNNLGIQAMLRRGVGSIVTKEFYNFLVKQYDFNPETGMSPSVFAEAQQAYENDRTGLNTIYNQPSGQRMSPVVDWRSDTTTTFGDRTNTNDDEQVLADYEAATAEIQLQDKRLEIEEKNIETQHKAIETELENVKKVIQKNIDETFKIFS